MPQPHCFRKNMRQIAQLVFHPGSFSGPKLLVFTLIVPILWLRLGIHPSKSRKCLLCWWGVFSRADCTSSHAAILWMMSSRCPTIFSSLKSLGNVSVHSFSSCRILGPNLRTFACFRKSNRFRHSANYGGGLMTSFPLKEVTDLSTFNMVGLLNN